MARVLTESWNRFHPGCPLFVLLLDSPFGFFAPEHESFHSVYISDLAIPNANGMLFKYTAVEARAAAKPYLFAHLFRQYGIQKLLYLDPDILVTASLDPLRRYLDEANVLLMPHVLSPLPEDDRHQNDHDILKSGAYNLGFLGLRQGEVADRLLGWWSGKLYHQCRAAIEQNLFLDQRWMDLAPGLFDGVRIVREPEYNVGYRNLHERRVEVGDDIRVNGEPLRFFHFSGFDPDTPWIASTHQNRFTTANIGGAGLLYMRYRDLLIEKGWNESRGWKYEHDYFYQGVRIPTAARKYYWGLGIDVGKSGDPFSWLSKSAAAGSLRFDPTQASRFPKGVNLIGYYQSETGVGEGARSNLRIIQSAGVRFAVNNWLDPTSQNVETLPRETTQENPYLVNLLTINADRIGQFADAHRSYVEKHFNIGYWAWELPEFPEDWDTAFGYVDEIWTPSRFTKAAIETRSPVPVKVVPHAMDPALQRESAVDRSAFGIDPETFVFLFTFDFHSYLERKNPLGLIHAYKKAFGNRRDVRLILKSCHGPDHKEDFNVVQRACSGSNIQVMDCVLTREDQQRLMMAADCYVSLHRSEGFGLTMAEAMVCGKPVIATAYSGNVDFMSDDNSFLVPYDLITIERSCGPYLAGYHWADPDLDSAVDLMRQVESRRDAAAQVGVRAAGKLRELLHPPTIAGPVRNRLEQLGLIEQVMPLDVSGSLPSQGSVQGPSDGA